MRQFAVATADLSNAEDVASLTRGLQEIERFTSETADWTPEMSTFIEWLGVMRGARGSVDPTISAEHYMMLVEAIFGRVRRQYPGGATAAFGLAGGAPTTGVTSTSLPVSHRLSSTFTVTLDDQLGGKPETNLRAIRAARANMKARVSQPFQLRFEEAPDAATLIAADDETLDTNSYKRKVKAFERRTLIAARQSRWEKGVELILWYGGTLFLGPDKVMEKACMIAIQNWFAVAATNVVNPGGDRDCWHDVLYSSHPMVFTFSAGGGLDFEVKPMVSLDPKIIASSFVPNLVSKYLYLLKTSTDLYLTDNRDDIFDVRFWLHGPH